MTKFKTLIMVVLQYIVVTLLWLAVIIEHGLTLLLERLVRPLPVMSPLALSILKDVAGRHKQARCLRKSSSADTHDPPLCNSLIDEDIKVILTVLDKQDSYRLNRDRKVFENIETGRQVVADHPDRHLYSVLRPTRQENLRRIENVLRAMSPAALRRVGENARRTMRIYS